MRCNQHTNSTNIGTITQPTCSTPTGSVQLTGLPAGTWTINPGAITGLGATYTVSGLATGSYTFTVKILLAVLRSHLPQQLSMRNHQRHRLRPSAP
ncbi:MAG: hypothetical protein U0X58_00695 [Flavobacteriaceae bacterium]